MPGKLSLVATPIGNLQDITLRALEVFKGCDLVACEDTRVAGKLLQAHGISKPFLSVHEHSTNSRLDHVMDKLREGLWVAYASDAGTPGVNDPGGKLVDLALEEGIEVEPIPGPSALTAAVSVCGFAMDEFVYLGFLPHKKGKQTMIADIAERKTPSIFFESTHRIDKTLEALEKALGATRKLFVGRELTKMHETLYRGTVADVRAAMAKTSSKGEFVLIVGPKEKG